MSDPFLYDLYQSLHESPLQTKFRRIQPWPVGAVFVQHPSMTMEDIRRHFRLMKELGFTALKQCQICRGTDRRAVMHMALDEGIIPWWYGEAGWEDPTPELLAELGIDPDISAEELAANPVWLARQDRLMRKRIDREATGHESGGVVAGGEPDRKKGKDWVPSVQPTFSFELSEEQGPRFLDWLKRQYGDIDTLNDAWNAGHCMIPGPIGENDPAVGGGRVGWQSWDHLSSQLLDVVNYNFREYRRTRDVFRFKADSHIDWLSKSADRMIAEDPHAPVRGGGEMGLFLPFASRGTDMEGIAESMKDRGSFYPSFHPAWHFEEVDFETPRAYYMQATLTTDWFKGGWNATWESTGGPQQMTGHKAPFVPEVREKKPGFTIDEGAMCQLMLSWIAGGYRGFGIWCWTPRTAGWEAGEFSLLDRNQRPGGRAVMTGRIGRACRRLRGELWQARKEPVVGVFQDWDMEAIWSAASRGGRDFFKSEPIRARIGAARALINHNVPWEHVTGANLRKGLGPRYKTIVVPAALAIGTDILELLRAYVEGGGRVVFDAPGGWYDYYGRMLSTDDGSAFERLFGCRIAEFQFSRERDRPWTIEGTMVEGTTFELQPTTADILTSFDHATANAPAPAVTRNRVGKGEAVVLAYEATRMCFRPGRAIMEDRLAKAMLGPHESPFACDGAIVYRLAAPAADHYFLLNDGEAREVLLDTKAMTYRSVQDPLGGDSMSPGDPIAIPRYGARWLRYVK